MKKKRIIIAAMIMAMTSAFVGCDTADKNAGAGESESSTTVVSDTETSSEASSEEAVTEAETSSEDTSAEETTQTEAVEETEKADSTEALPDENNSNDADDEVNGMLDEGGNFLGKWECDKASMEVTEGDVGGRYVVTITMKNSETETSIWTYKCKYSEEEKGLISDSGQLSNEVCESEDAEPKITVTDGQEAVFTLDSDGIKWNDKVNNSGADMIFAKQ